MAVYARKTFGMFTGEEVKVHLRFEIISWARTRPSRGGM